jgi:hypothetical protein
LKNLKQEPEADEDERIDLDEYRDEQDRDDYDKPRQWKQAHITSENACDCAGGAQCGFHRRGVKDDVGD